MEEGRMFLAIDLGATSGRAIVGTLAEGVLTTEEVARFPNRLIEADGHVRWDLDALFAEIVEVLGAVAERGLPIESIGIDTWGVDFVCFGPDGRPLCNPFSYRDAHTFAALEDYLANILDRRQLYDKTGLQMMNFNSLFQLHALRRERNTALEQAAQILFMPDALGYLLTGAAVCEYTIASTSQLLDGLTKELSDELLATVGLRRGQFGRMVLPGTIVGTLTEEVQRTTGLGPVPVIAVAGHDTASAVAAVPAATARFAYLSSGTWSLMGIETAAPIITPRSRELDFTNEGGIGGTTRFLKNICGMWLYERCRREWGEDLATHADLLREAMQTAAFRSLIYPDDAAFANPQSMVGAIQDFCRSSGQPVPESRGELCRCIFDSLAMRYRQVFGWLQEFYAEHCEAEEQAGKPIEVVHVVGGGSRNALLNQLTADACNAVVMAGPQECTALGNIMVQAKACGMAADVWDMRRIIARAVSPRRYEPSGNEREWRKAYDRYLAIAERNRP